MRKIGGGAVLLLGASFSLITLSSLQWPLVTTLLFDPLGGFREYLAKLISGVNPDSAAIVLGLTLGDDSQVSAILSDAMKTTSLTHLMAVSGANCAIVVGAIYFVLARLSIRLRVGASLCALFAYVLLVGLQPSVLRASVMAGAVLLSLGLGRKINPLSALALCVLVLLSLDPTLAKEYGFALSVLATTGILIATPEIYKRLLVRMPKWLAMGLSVSIGAQLFCFPVLVGLQGGLPTYSLLANLLCEPLVMPITIIGLVATLFFWLQPIASAFFWLASLVAWPIPKIATLLAGLPMATMPWRVDGIGISLAVFLMAATIGLLYAKSAARRNLSALMVAILLASSFGIVVNQFVRTSIWPMSDWQISSCDVGQGDATVIRDRGSVALIDVGRDEKKIDSCLSKLGILRIDLLVLTHFDADHVNGLSGAIKNRSVAQAMVTSFQDERPGADFSRFQIAARTIPIVQAETGMNGRVGSVRWKVLSPSRTAIEAEDSNDGSITMLFQFSNFQLITLADLGEKGQMRLASTLGSWYNDSSLPLVMKVAHHGSADQFPEFIEWLKPELALISVGKNNGYGHPTQRTIAALNRAGAVLLRTDLLGSISLKHQVGEFEVSYTGSS
jgi:competence protein ComEC